MSTPQRIEDLPMLDETELILMQAIAKPLPGAIEEALPLHPKWRVLHSKNGVTPGTETWAIRYFDTDSPEYRTIQLRGQDTIIVPAGLCEEFHRQSYLRDFRNLTDEVFVSLVEEFLSRHGL